MSYKEALADKIRIENNNHSYGCTNYFPHCRFCGAEVKTITYNPNHHYYCPDCKKHKKVLLSTGLFD